MKDISGIPAPFKRFTIKALSFLCCIILLLFVDPITGQTLITGQISLSEKSDVSGISVLVLSSLNSQEILTYSISNNSGRFRLSFTSSSDSVLVAFKSLNFKDTIVGMANRSRELNVVLQPDVFELKDSICWKGLTQGPTKTFLINRYFIPKSAFLVRSPGIYL